MSDTAEATIATDILVAELQVLHGIPTDIQNDLPVLYVASRYLRVFVHLHCQIRGISGIRAPFIDGADQVGLGGRLVYHGDYLRMAFSAGVSASMKP